jgi:haloalkane dehalogenase
MSADMKLSQETTGMAFDKRLLAVDGRMMAAVDVGDGDAIVFLHGNPTSSYLWRNVIPHLQSTARCIAPDLIGMGDSDKLPDSGPASYTFQEHRRFLDGLLDALRLGNRVVIVGHDWGSALGFDWARRHQERVIGIAYMEAIVQPLMWNRWSAETRTFFEQLRSPAGERMVLDENLFVESLLPRRMLRRLSDEELDAYRRPFRQPGEARRPMLTWPRQLPIEGEPADVVDVVRAYGAWLSTSPIPKLFINAEPGAMSADERRFCRTWPNQTEVTVRGVHFIQEDSPDDIGRALARWYEAACHA